MVDRKRVVEVLMERTRMRRMSPSRRRSRRRQQLSRQLGRKVRLYLAWFRDEILKHVL